VSVTVVTPAVLRRWPLPQPGGGKEDRGHLLVVAGTATTPGAALLAAEAGLRAGAGKLTVATSEATAAALGVSLPEALVEGLLTDDTGSIAESEADRIAGLAGDVDAVVIGPGFTEPEATVRLLSRLAPRLAVPTVLDATASAYLGQRPDGLRHLAGRSVLTVNPSELARTAHRSDSSVEDDPAPVAAQVAEAGDVVVLCGGTVKHVLAPDGTHWAVEDGGPALAVSGSGDVQAGIVAGLLARGVDAPQAAVWGAYLHGRSGERLAASTGAVGALARDLLPHIPRVLTEVG
jgi:ADP-dependent NAD(P)H-hydrate dehydratase